MAERIGIRAVTLHSENFAEWSDVRNKLRAGACDVLLVSPERLANQNFLTQVLPEIRGGIGLFVVDEAHCISDWGHDFRPDYRRILGMVHKLPLGVPLLATTATANDRVVADIEEQLGPSLATLRGPLTRDSLKLQNIQFGDQAERLAWLVENLPRMPGSGIIYCLTIADCRRTAAWLRQNGIDTREYHADLPKEWRPEREQALLLNQVKALVATVALGMGFDKPDLGFVIHFQRPGSLVKYYQQIGRAGRALDEAYAILLNGEEDDEITDYFIRTAFPGAEAMAQVLESVEKADDGADINHIQTEQNLSYRAIERCLKHLEVEGAISREKWRYYRTAQAWRPDEARWEAITKTRCQELEKIREFASTNDCLMEFIARDLNDPDAHSCGRCANCAGNFFSAQTPARLVESARFFLQADFQPIEPRVYWPSNLTSRKNPIPHELQLKEGAALSLYGDAGWGRQVKRDKYQNGCFGEALVEASADLIGQVWRPQPFPTWVTAVPSLRRPELMASFASRLAKRLGVPFLPILRKIKEVPPQKEMRNSAQQAANAERAFSVAGQCLPGPVLLVDDMFDSRWTLTYCGVKLRQAGSGPVYPFTLARATSTEN